MQIQKASMFKRISAAMMDFCLVLILGMLLSSFICSPIINSTTDYVEKNYEYNEELFDLGYIVIGKYNSDNKLEFYASYDSENNAELKKLVKEHTKEYKYALLTTEGFNFDNATYEKHLTHFYTKLNALQSYNNKKSSKTDLFVKNENNNYVVKDEVQTNETLKNSLHDFYVNTYNESLNDKKIFENYKDGIVIKISNRINFLNQMCVYLALIIAVTILYLILPLILKKGQTLGKKMMGVKVVNKKDGSPVNFVTVIIRFFAFAVIEFFLSITLNIFYLPIIISLVIMIVNKQGQSLHDLLARTVVVDIEMQNYLEETSIDKNAIEVPAEEVSEGQTDKVENEVLAEKQFEEQNISEINNENEEEIV